MNKTFALTQTPEEIRRDIVGRVRQRRKAMGLSQQRLAAKSGVSLGSVKRFERTGEISLTSLIKIAFALESEDDFLKLFESQYYTSIQEIIDAQH